MVSARMAVSARRLFEVGIFLVFDFEVYLFVSVSVVMLSGDVDDKIVSLSLMMMSPLILDDRTCSG